MCITYTCTAQHLFALDSAAVGELQSQLLKLGAHVAAHDVAEDRSVQRRLRARLDLVGSGVEPLGVRGNWRMERDNKIGITGSLIHLRVSHHCHYR